MIFTPVLDLIVRASSGTDAKLSPCNGQHMIQHSEKVHSWHTNKRQQHAYLDVLANLQQPAWAQSAGQGLCQLCAALAAVLSSALGAALAGPLTCQRQAPACFAPACLQLCLLAYAVLSCLQDSCMSGVQPG